jgi:CheY-like chemotaxis protein/signal transduction histidine kinase
VGLPSIPENRPRVELGSPTSMPFATDSPVKAPPRTLTREDSTGSQDAMQQTANPLAGGTKAPGAAPMRSAHTEMSDYIAYYMQALQNDPTDPSLHNVLGVALAKQGDLDMAIKHYTTALELDGAFFPAHYNLGRARYRQGRAEEAIDHYEYSLQLHPGDKKAHNSLGIVLAEQGKVEEAISHFQEASRIMEGMLEMQPINQRFQEPALEDEFAKRRTQQAMIPTRLLIIVSMIATGVNFAYSMYDFLVGEQAVLLEQQVERDIGEAAGDRSFSEHEETLFDSRLHALIYGVELAVGFGTLGLTWHRAFYRLKPLVLSVYIVTYFVGVLIMAWLTLREESDGYEIGNGIIVSLNWKLHTTFLSLVRDFTISLALPQVCGLRWTLMPIIYTILAGTYCALIYTTPNLAAFVSPVLLVGIMLVGVLMAYSVEQAERDEFKMGKLYITEKECRAQSEADWRKAAAERHESDLAKTAAQTELRTRSQFVSWIFHEIRNPLNAMWGAIQMFGATASSPKQKEWVAMAMASSNMVSNVLNDVLSLNKIEEGHLDLKCGWFSIVGAIEEVKFMFNEEAVRNGVQLRCSVGDVDTGGFADQHEIKVYADVDRLKEVLANFCSNAIKFTESGGTVHLHADITMRPGASDRPVRGADGEFEPTADIEVSVTDTGQGIAAVDFDKLFVAYSQITPAVRASGRGKSSTGLGLCITKHIIDAHGGEVYVRSDGLGKGSTFGFVLAVPTTTVDVQMHEGGQSTESFATPFSDTPAPEGDADYDLDTGTAPHVLIVDDDEFNCRVIQDMVQSVGWTCDTAIDGASALELIGCHGAGHFACVVSDCIMPVLDGWQLTEEIQRQMLPLPVVGLTGSVSEVDLERCREVGMKEVLTKPVKMADLVQTVRRVVQSAIKMQQRRVLLVDDDDFNLAIVKDMLDECGWACVTAQSGLEALEILATQNSGLAGESAGSGFACVVTDMIMPGMDGCELATQIRALGDVPLLAGAPPPKPPPVVGLTGTTQSSELQRCLDSGMATVLSKPVDMRELNSTLETLTAPRPSSPRTSPRSAPPSPGSIPALRAPGGGVDKALASPVGRPNPLEEFDLEAGMAGMGIAVGGDSSVAGVKGNGSAGVARSPRSNGAATATEASSDGRATSTGAGSVAIGGLIGSSSLPTVQPADAAKAGGGVGVGHLPSSLDFFEDVTATPTFAGSSVETFDAGLTNEEDDL